MDRIRVILSGLPPMLRDVVCALVKDQTDMVLVGETESATHLPSLARRMRADVVIIGADSDGISAAGRRVVNRQPHVKLIALDGDGGQAWLYELRPHEERVGDITPQTLAGTIRAAMQTGAVPMEITGESPIRSVVSSASSGGAAT